MMAQALAAANASITLNGLSISSTTNTLTNVIDGLSVTLSKTTSAGPASRRRRTPRRSASPSTASSPPTTT